MSKLPQHSLTIAQHIQEMANRPCADCSVTGLRIADRGQLLRDGYSRDFSAGAVHEICAPNGAGKSTLLTAMAGIADFESGNIRYCRNGIDLAQDSTAITRAAWIAWLPPDDNFLVPQHPLDVVLAGRWRFHQGKPGTLDREIAGACMLATGIDPGINKRTTELSSGQKRRLSLARIFAQDADVLLLDEPWRGLDEAGKEDITSLLQELARLGRNVIIAKPV